MPDLHALRLDSNRLVDFGQSFVNLRFLLMLNISNNRIQSFDYAQIPLGLQWLDLHSNRIDKLNNFYYSQLAQQQYNNLNQQTIPQMNSLSSNEPQASPVGQQWSSWLKLTTLDASYNLIRELDNTSLPDSLESVQLNNNQLRSIASHTFATKTNLTRINLSANQLTVVPIEAFKLNPQLKATNSISNNQRDNHHHQQQASPTNKLVDLYLANNPFQCNCQMHWLSQLLLASASLTWNNNNGSQLTATNQLANQLMLSPFPIQEQQLILARQLPRIVDANQVKCHLPFARQAWPFFMNGGGGQTNNNINYNSNNNFAATPHLWSPLAAALSLAGQAGANDNKSNFHNNNKKSHHHQQNQQISINDNHQSSQVSMPRSFNWLTLTRQAELLSSVHLCPYKSHCFAMCQCCDYDACDCEMSCPENCSCYYDHSWSTNIVDCSASNGNAARTAQHQHQSRASISTKIPERIPMDVSDLYLDGLSLTSIRWNSLIGRKNLRLLYMNNSQIELIERKAFSTQKALKLLQLNNNQLQSLWGYEFEELTELKELYLAHNKLSFIANGTFANLRQLQVLHLHHNQLHYMNLESNINVRPSTQLAGGSGKLAPTISKLMSVTLGSNPWSCECELVERMLKWLHLNVNQLADRSQIKCQWNATSALNLLSSVELPAATQQAGFMEQSQLATPDFGLEDTFELSKCLNHTVLLQQDNDHLQSQSLATDASQELTMTSSTMSSVNDDPLTLINNNRKMNTNPANANNINNNQMNDMTTPPQFHWARSQEPAGSELFRADPFAPESSSLATPSSTSQLNNNQQFGSLSNNQTTSLMGAVSGWNRPASLLGLGLLALVGLLILVALGLIARTSNQTQHGHNNSLLRRPLKWRWFSQMVAGRRDQRLATMFQQPPPGHNPVVGLGAHSMAADKLTAHSHHAHLHYGVSSASSLASSSAASSGCQTHKQTSATLYQNAGGGAAGILVTTTPLIYGSGAQAHRMLNTTTTATTHNQHQVTNSMTSNQQQQQKSAKLFDAYLSYARADEQFVNELLAPELESGPCAFR